MINKRGELTTQQLVGIIILIISFVVILFFIFRLNLGETTDKEICHNSIVMKSQSVLGSGNLDCKTSYVCISGGGKCENFNPSRTIDINMNQDELEIKNDVMKAIADEMADCWWMFGEGKVDYVGRGLIFEKGGCSLCSVLVFDKNIAVEKFSYEDFYGYLKKTKKDSSQTYLQYFYVSGDLSTIENNFKFPEGYFSNSFDFSKSYAVLTGKFSEAYFKPKLSFFVETNPVPVVVIEKTSKNYESLGCDKFLTKA